ncbi:MAG: hypothetical protein Q8M16_09070 [Pirellulaceae bacterium]|nr:hypothetical protein [Pirellulaceae bacterium]
MSAWLRYWWLGILLAFIVLVVQRLPHEIKQWRLAWAAEQASNGNAATAQQQIEPLASADPENLGLQLAFIETLIENKASEQASTAAHALSANKDLKPGQRQRLAGAFHRLHLHEMAYHQLQQAYREFEESRNPKTEVRDQDVDKEAAKPVELSAYERLVWTNSLAYAAYLSDRDLDSRWREINTTLRQTGLEDQFAIYRSHSLRIVGRSEEGLAIIRAAVRSLEQRFAEENQQLSERLGHWMSQPKWPDAEEPAALRQVRSNVLEIQSMLRLLYGQAAILSQDVDDDLGRREFSNKAIRATIGLDHTELDLSPQVVAQQLLQIASYLDTRGALATKTRRWKRAQTDLNAAIQAAYLARAITLDSGLANSPAIVDVRSIRQQEATFDEALAVFHYHRAMLAEAQSDSDAAVRDLAAVRRLGHEPGPELH